MRSERPRAPLRAFGVYTGKRAREEDGVRVLPWRDFLRALWDGGIAS